MSGYDFVHMQDEVNPQILCIHVLEDTFLLDPAQMLCFRIIALCQENPEGVTDNMIQTDRPHFDVKQRVMAINRLLSTVSGEFDVLSQSIENAGLIKHSIHMASDQGQHNLPLIWQFLARLHESTGRAIALPLA